MSASTSVIPDTGPAGHYAQRNAAYWRRNLAVCVFGSFTTLVSLTMLLPFLPLYVQRLGETSQAGIVRASAIAFGATFLGTGLTAPLLGRLADRYGRKPMLVRAAIGMAIVMSLIGIAHSVLELVLLRLLAGLVGGFASASMVLIGTQAPRERSGWALGVLASGALAGNLVGPLVGGFLPGWVGIRGSFFVGGAMIAAAALATIFLVREDFERACDGHMAAAGNPQPRRPGARIVTATLMVTAMMVLLCNMSIEPIITVFIGHLGVVPARQARFAGLIMAATALGSMLTASRLGALADRVGSWNVIVGCLVATALVLLPQAMVTRWWQLALLRGLMGMTVAGLLPSIAKLVRLAAQDTNAGRTLGYLQSSQFAGQVIGPLLGAQIATELGMRGVFVATAGLLLLCAALAHGVRSRHVGTVVARGPKWA